MIFGVSWVPVGGFGVPTAGFGVLQELRERVLRGKYRIPFYMSTDCENLLKKFLILNPTKRGTLEVRGHPNIILGPQRGSGNL